MARIQGVPGNWIVQMVNDAGPITAETFFQLEMGQFTGGSALIQFTNSVGTVTARIVGSLISPVDATGSAPQYISLVASASGNQEIAVAFPTGVPPWPFYALQIIPIASASITDLTLDVHRRGYIPVVP